jgi:perosamine synthetase
VDECIRSTWISSKGRFVAEFEEKFGEYCGIPYAVSVCNGTMALHVALVALGIGAGDEVIVPTLSYVASANTIIYTGAKPVFVDSLLDTWQLDPSEIEKKITPATKAIMAVHLYGHPADMDKIVAVAKKYKLLIVEDCAEAIGTFYKKRHVGNFGDVACFSFFGNKTITTGEGGMILTANKTIADKVMKLKGQGLKEGREYWHDVIGYNYRMTNICAAIGTAQLEQIDKFTKRKRQIAKLYQQSFKKRQGVLFHQAIGDVVHSYWMCSILLKNRKVRDGLRAHLDIKGIETRPLFYPTHKLPIYKTGESFPVAESLSRRGVNLPSWPGLTDSQLFHVSDTIVNYLERSDG